MNALPRDIARLASAPHALAAGLYSGQHVLVSGGGSGIGQAIAWLMVRLGARVTICGRSQARLDAASAGFLASGFSVLARVCDIRDESAVSALFEDATSNLGELDLLVNNAG